MPAELPTIASCPHCRTILLRTPSELVHPLADEREGILEVLGGFWFDHARVRFDGRFHRCHAIERARVKSRSQRPALLHEARALWSLAALAALLVPCAARGDDRAAPLSLADQGRPAASSRWHAAGAHVPAQAPAAEPPALVVDAAPRLETEPRAAGSWVGSELADGRYEVVDTIREGSEGAVYLAHDRNIDACVAIEVPRSAEAEGPGSAARFVRQARALARLDHPHLARVTAVGTHRDALFLVTEHFSGGSLRFRRPVGPDGRPAPAGPESLGSWLAEVAAVLDYLRNQNRPYRGLTPASIVFDAEGRPYVAGLGMSWSPEVGASEPAAERSGIQTDQQALAAAVYELLCARVPRASGETPDEPRQVSPAVPSALSAVVMRGLSDKPQAQFADCASFARAAISAAATIDAPLATGGAPVATQTARADPKSRSWPVSNSAAIGIAGSMLLALAGVKTLRRKRSPSDISSTPTTAPGAAGDLLPVLAALARHRGRRRMPIIPAVLQRDPADHRDDVNDACMLPPHTGRALDPPASKVLGHRPANRALAAAPDVDANRKPVRAGLAKRLFPLSATLRALPPRAAAQLPEVRRRKAS